MAPASGGELDVPTEAAAVAAEYRPSGQGNAWGTYLTVTPTGDGETVLAEYVVQTAPDAAGGPYPC